MAQIYGKIEYIENHLNDPRSPTAGPWSIFNTDGMKLQYDKNSEHHEMYGPVYYLILDKYPAGVIIYEPAYNKYYLMSSDCTIYFKCFGKFYAGLYPFKQEQLKEHMEFFLSLNYVGAIK